MPTRAISVMMKKHFKLVSPHDHRYRYSDEVLQKCAHLREHAILGPIDKNKQNEVAVYCPIKWHQKPRKSLPLCH